MCLAPGPQGSKTGEARTKFRIKPENFHPCNCWVGRKWQTFFRPYQLQIFLAYCFNTCYFPGELLGKERCHFSFTAFLCEHIEVRSVRQCCLKKVVKQHVILKNMHSITHQIIRQCNRNVIIKLNVSLFGIKI